jgi:hypothetical protein
LLMHLQISPWRTTWSSNMPKLRKKLSVVYNSLLTFGCMLHFGSVTVVLEER